jgi:hypothetical protein
MKRDRQIPEVPKDDPAAKYPKDLTAQYPLQLVATVAAQLLVGDDYDGAAERALALIEACEDELSYRNEGARTQLTYHDALRFVTGEKREDRALPDYRRFLHDDFLEMRRLSPFVVELDVKTVRSEGLSLAQARMQRELFKKWKARRKSSSASTRGKMGAKARTEKKRLKMVTDD